MFIPPKPVFNTPPLPRAAPDASLPNPPPEPRPTPSSTDPVSVSVLVLVPVVGAAGDAGSSELTSDTPSTDTDSVATTSTTVPPLAPATATPLPETALATDIQHFGHRNFVGLLVLGLLALLGLVLWLSFGAWPRRVMRRVRARFSSGGKAGTEGGQGYPAVDLRGHMDAAAARDSREPSENEKGGSPSEEEDKDKPSCSPRSTELDSEVESLEKGPGMVQDTTMPRVRSTRC